MARLNAEIWSATGTRISSEKLLSTSLAALLSVWLLSVLGGTGASGSGGASSVMSALVSVNQDGVGVEVVAHRPDDVDVTEPLGLIEFDGTLLE